MIELIELNEYTIVIQVMINGSSYELVSCADHYELRSSACARWSGHQIRSLDLAVRLYEDWTKEAQHGR